MINHRVRCTLMALSTGAGVIHIAIIGPHFEESIWFGVFFLIVAAFQLVWAGPILGRSDRWVLVLGSAFNLGVVLVWFLSRTAGVPLGPDAGNPEPVALADAIATGFEILVVFGAVVLIGWRARVREFPLVGSLGGWSPRPPADSHCCVRGVRRGSSLRSS